MLRLFRPELPFAAGVCVVLGEYIAGGSFPGLRELSLGFACGFFLSAAALILNDIFDLEVDRVNTPERPLPAGLVTKTEALGLGALVTLLGLAAGALIGPAALAVCLLLWLIGFLYNWRFKESGLPGNLMVSVSVAATFILGGLAAGRPRDRLVWTFALIAFFIDLGEEIAGDAMDATGDRKRGSRSLAILFGRQVAVRIAAALLLLTIPLSLLPFLLGWLGVSYLVVISLTDLVTLFFTVRLLTSHTPGEGRRAMRGIYLGALCGMLAFLVGQV
jgi:geranylgeranylglycerol-phosphate geranylgeranyltransferase